MKTKQYVLRILISLIAFFLFAQCSNTGTNRTSAACRNQCLVEQSLCYLVTTQGGALRSAEPNLTCQFLFVSCLSGCDATKRYTSSSRSSSRSSSSSGGGRSGGGSSGGGSSGGGSSGGGHGGSGH